jgi:peptide/nickel transport system permease protein
VFFWRRAIDRELEQVAASQAAASSQSPTQLVVRRLLSNPAAVTGLVLLVFLYSAALLAEFLSPNSPTTERRALTNHPPTLIRVIDEDGKLRWPFVYGMSLRQEYGRQIWTYELDRKYPVHFFSNIGWSYRFLGLMPTQFHLMAVEQGGVLAPFGLDEIGRCVMARTLHGARVSLSVGLFGIAITLGLGLTLGGLSGYLGGRFDAVMMRVSEFLMSIPELYLILAIGFFLRENTIFGIGGETLGPLGRYLMIIGVLGLIGWAGPARVVRGMALSLKEREYVLAARALGASTPRILLVHILPGTFAYAIVSASIAVPGFILGEITLSYLDLGIKEPGVSWGLMLEKGTSLETIRSEPWKLLAPASGIFLAVMAFNFLGDGLRDALDPRTKN